MPTVIPPLARLPHQCRDVAIPGSRERGRARRTATPRASGEALAKALGELLTFSYGLVELIFVVKVVGQRGVDLCQGKTGVGIADLVRGPSQPLVLKGDVLDLDPRSGDSLLSATDPLVSDNVGGLHALRSHSQSPDASPCRSAGGQVFQVAPAVGLHRPQAVAAELLAEGAGDLEGRHGLADDGGHG